MSNQGPSNELAGQVALVTGGSSGIGQAICVRLAQAGAKIAFTGRSPEHIAESVAAIEAATGLGGILAVPCDVSQEEDVLSVFRQTLLTFGRLDIVVSNAGLIRSAPIELTTLADWNQLMGVLATGSYLAAREAFRVWKQQGPGGRLIFITSKNAVVASPLASIYSAAKAATQHLARCLAEEGGPHGIRVNCVMPDGIIRGTHILPPGELEKSSARHGVKPEDIDEYYRQRNALKVNIIPQDVAEAVMFLVSARSSKITGAALTVDGGMVAAYQR